jgi:hypothetical protein
VIVPGLISQHRFAERIESVLFAIVARDSFHLLTPFPWGCRVDFSLSANMTPEIPDSTRFFENFQKYFLKQVDFQAAIEKPSRPKTANWT